MPTAKTPNIILFGIDSLRSDHMSLYGYPRLTTPHMDRLAARGCVFENAVSPSIPTTPGYSSMFTGMDMFGTDCVALRHQGPLGGHVRTLAEILGDNGYTTSCVGFSGNCASRGFQRYLDFPGWGMWEQGRSPKAENLNSVAIPELKTLAADDKPFFLFLRHMDPHSPYLPPGPFERIFYGANECDPNNRSLDKLYDFKPFRDYLASWFPPGCTDKDYVIAQYDGAVAYMDAAIANILATVTALGIDNNTLLVFDSDHGETLYDHDCYFDHHGLYEPTLRVPMFFVLPRKVPAGMRFKDPVYLKDVTPTILDILGIDTEIEFDGRSLVGRMYGEPLPAEPESYITEATWMRKHGWRTQEWKLIHALEPDFHFKPEVELYNLVTDPEENCNVADREPEVVKFLEARMQAHIARRTEKTGRPNPIDTNLNWNGHGGPFKTSQEAYDTLYIGSPKAAQELQARELQTQRGAKEL